MSETVFYQRNWYLPTYLRGNDDVTLTGHVYTITGSRHGAITLGNEIACWDFPTDQEMVEFIRETQAAELPQQADGNPSYVPEQVQQCIERLQARN